MDNQLAEALPPRTHNEPPLREVITEALAPFLPIYHALLETAATSVIIDDESAKKVIDLSEKIRDIAVDIENARKEMKEPHLVAGRTIDTEFGARIRPLTVTRAGLVDMLNAHEAKKRREAEAARQAALANQRRREEEAEALRRAAEETTAAGKSGVAEELDALAAQEAANAAARRAEAIRPAPVHAQLGSLGSRRGISFDIEDPRKLVAWMLKQPMRSNLEQALRTIMGLYLRQLGVAAVDGGAAIPGVKAWVDTQTVVRR